jgi:transaldolase
MALFLETVPDTDVSRAVELGFVWGATVHPALMIGAGGAPPAIISELCELLSGPVFCPLTAPTRAEREAVAMDLVEISPSKVGLVLPCTTENLSLLARLTDDGITCGATGVLSLHQVLAACEAGAHFILPDITQIGQLQGSGLQAVGDMRDVVEAVDTGAEILVTGIESPADVADVVLAGAHHVALSLELLLALGEHPSSGQANEGV